MNLKRGGFFYHVIKCKLITGFKSIFNYKSNAYHLDYLYSTYINDGTVAINWENYLSVSDAEMKEWSDSFLAYRKKRVLISSKLTKLVMSNARYIKTNFNIILAYISEYNPTIVAFTETLLSSNDIYIITMLSNFSTNLYRLSYLSFYS